MVGCGSSSLTGTLTLTVQGDDVPAPLSDGVAVDWDDEVNWTRQILCLSGGDLGSPTYAVKAYDRSIGDGLEFGLNLLAYDGPGDYERDEFQPESALTVNFTPADDDQDDDDDDESDDDDSAGDDDDSAGDDDDSAGDDDDSASEDDDDPEDDEDDDEGDERDDDEGEVYRFHWGSDSGGVCEVTVDDGGTSGVFVCRDVAGFFAREEIGSATLAGEWTCSDLRSDDDGGWSRGDDDVDLSDRFDDRF